jgi:hypothetical protein
MDLGEDEEGYGETLKVMDLTLGRAPEPQTTTGEVFHGPAYFENSTWETY